MTHEGTGADNEVTITEEEHEAYDEDPSFWCPRTRPDGLVSKVMAGNFQEDWGDWFLTIKSSEVDSDGTNSFDPSSLIVGEDWDLILRDFCDRNNIEWQEPKWFLTSSYG